MNDFLHWWFEVIDGKGGHSFVIGLYAMPKHEQGYIIRTPAVSLLDRQNATVRTLFFDYRLGKELKNTEECCMLLNMFGDDPFRTPHEAVFSWPLQSETH